MFLKKPQHFHKNLLMRMFNNFYFIERKKRKLRESLWKLNGTRLRKPVPRWRTVKTKRIRSQRSHAPVTKRTKNTCRHRWNARVPNTIDQLEVQLEDSIQQTVILCTSSTPSPLIPELYLTNSSLWLLLTLRPRVPYRFLSGA